MTDDLQAQKVIDFVQTLKQVGDFYGQPFHLLPWEEKVLRDVYGTVDADGHRQYRIVYIESGKKNGRSSLGAALSIYHMICDPPGGLIYSAGAEQKQSEIIYNYACDMIEQSPILSSLLKIRRYKHEVIHRNKKMGMVALSASAFSKTGMNPSIVFIDELQSHKSRDLYDSLTFGSGAARREQLIWVFSNAGDIQDKSSIAYEVHNKAQLILNGDVTDPTFYPCIFSAQTGCDIMDEEQWAMANPSLGVSVQIDTVLQEATQAQYDVNSERLFRRLRLNQWV